MRVKSRRAVSKSVSILPLSRFIRSSVPSLCSGAPAHIQRFDLRRRRGADGLVIAVADQEIILDDAAERRQRQQDAPHARAALARDVEHQAVFLHAQRQAIGTAGRTLGLEVLPSRRSEIATSRSCSIAGVRLHHAFFVQGDGADAMVHSASPGSAARRWSGHALPALRPRPARWRRGPSAAMAPASKDSKVVRFMKSSTESPEEKRAEREVGSTWLGPAI